MFESTVQVFLIDGEHSLIAIDFFAGNDRQQDISSRRREDQRVMRITDGLMRRPGEIDDGDIGLQSFAERAYLFVNTERTRAAERGREQRLLCCHRGVSLVSRAGVAVADAGARPS